MASAAGRVLGTRLEHATITFGVFRPVVINWGLGGIGLISLITGQFDLCLMI